MTWWGVCRDFNLSSIASVKAHYVSVYLKHFQTSAWTFSPCYLMKYGSVLESSFLLLLLLHSCRMLKSLRGVQTLKVHHVSYLNQLQLMYECFLCTAFTGPAEMCVSSVWGEWVRRQCEQCQDDGASSQRFVAGGSQRGQEAGPPLHL